MVNAGVSRYTPDMGRQGWRLCLLAWLAAAGLAACSSTVEIGEADWTAEIAAAPATIKADGTDPTTVTVRVHRRNGEPIVGLPLQVVVDHADVSTAAPTDAAGLSSVQVRSSAPGER